MSNARNSGVRISSVIVTSPSSVNSPANRYRYRFTVFSSYFVIHVLSYPIGFIITWILHQIFIFSFLIKHFWYYFYYFFSRLNSPQPGTFFFEALGKSTGGVSSAISADLYTLQMYTDFIQSLSQIISTDTKVTYRTLFVVQLLF